MKLWEMPGYGREHISLNMRRQVSVGRCTVQAFDISPNGRLFATVGVDGTLHHNVLIGNEFAPETQKFNNGYMSMRFCAMIGDGYLTLSFKGQLQIVGFDGQIKKSVDVDPSHIKLRSVTAIAISSDGSQIALASSEGHVCLIEADTLKSSPNFEAHMKRIRSMSFLSNNERLLTACDDKTIRLHNVEEQGHKKPLHTYCGHTALVASIAVDRHADDKRFVSCGYDKRSILWDVATGEKLHIFDAAYESPLTCVSISLDGRYFALGGEDGSLFLNELPAVKDKENVPEEATGDAEAMQVDDHPTTTSPMEVTTEC
uniref:WD_REPEATS_REGION domain-containing protein n=1 Tax=Steinernema glaseri TaxID=37863 RepID=A0A1I7YMU0_9BILA